MTLKEMGTLTWTWTVRNFSEDAGEACPGISVSTCDYGSFMCARRPAWTCEDRYTVHTRTMYP